MKVVLAGMVLAVLTVVATWHLAYPSYTHRYRLTLEVEAGGTVRRGSGVIEVTWSRQPDVFGAWRFAVRGQAVPVDLGPHGVLLAALAGAGPPESAGVPARSLALAAFAGMLPELRTQGSVRGVPDVVLECGGLSALARSVGRRAELRPAIMPQLVWLPDLHDPATARPVPPADLPTVIAPDVRLRGAWVEITRDPVTTGLFSVLP
jgi:hypothetical protein